MHVMLGETKKWHDQQIHIVSNIFDSASHITTMCQVPCQPHVQLSTAISDDEYSVGHEFSKQRLVAQRCLVPSIQHKSLSLSRMFRTTLYPDFTVYCPLFVKFRQYLSLWLVRLMAKLLINGISSVCTNIFSISTSQPFDSASM